MASSNLGRVQGGGFYASTSTSTTSIAKSTIKQKKISPLLDDIIVNANGDLLQVKAISSDGATYTVEKFGNIKGPAGSMKVTMADDGIWDITLT